MGQRSQAHDDEGGNVYKGRAAAALALDATERIVQVDTASSPYLRDLASLQADFSLALRFLETYLGTEDTARSVESSDEALWIAAMTMYGRAFANGRRHHARPRLEILSTAQTKAHEYVIDARNKFIAHSVNAFDQAAVFAILTGDTPTTVGIRGVGVQQTNLRTLSSRGAHELADLCRVQMADIEERMAVARSAVAEELRQLGPEHALQLPPLSDVAIDQTRVRGAR